ncbi:MAG: HEAT repeat domain-containing protein [Myxococcota bacterium]|nr:HEAT repeat domain-containing protein [Myxococcota bacterium]
MSRLSAILPLVLVLVAATAHADTAGDLLEAADAQVPEATRLEAFDRLVRTGQTDISHVRTVAVTVDADTRQRWVAIRVLGKVRGDGPRDVLLGLLDDEQPAIRAAATQALGDLGDRNTTTQLIEQLKDPAVIVRAGAAEALGKLGDRTAVSPLADALQARDNYYRGSSLWVRSHFVLALGEIGDRKAVPTLLRALDDGDAGVQVAAVAAMERVAGFSYAEGRDADQQREAWRRWGQAQVR